jgi:hypothetical protein
MQRAIYVLSTAAGRQLVSGGFTFLGNFQAMILMLLGTLLLTMYR